MDYVIEQGRRERKRRAIRQNLLEAASTLFAERGVARTTIDEIAEAADVARQTLFNHFPYKEALALELASDAIRQLAERAYALLEAGTSAIEVLEQVARGVLDYSIDHGESAAVVARELLHHDPERATRAEGCVPLGPLFEAILIQAREEGSIRSDLPLDVVAGRVSIIFATIVAQSMNNDAASLRRDLSVCFDMLFNGISERRT